MITPEKLRELLTYDVDENVFYWNKKSAWVAKGAIAGGNTPNIITIDGVKYSLKELRKLWHESNSSDVVIIEEVVVEVEEPIEVVSTTYLDKVKELNDMAVSATKIGALLVADRLLQEALEIMRKKESK